MNVLVVCTTLYTYGRMKALCKSRTGVHLGKYSMCGETFFVSAAILRGGCLPLIPKVRVRVRVRVTLRLSVYRQSVRLGDKPLETTTTNFIFQLNTCGYSPYVTSSLTRGCVCRLQWLLGLASAVILSESRGTHDHILLSKIREIIPRRVTL
jgi:hypothetical protein